MTHDPRPTWPTTHRDPQLLAENRPTTHADPPIFLTHRDPLPYHTLLLPMCAKKLGVFVQIHFVPCRRIQMRLCITRLPCAHVCACLCCESNWWVLAETLRKGHSSYILRHLRMTIHRKPINQTLLLCMQLFVATDFPWKQLVAIAPNDYTSEVNDFQAQSWDRILIVVFNAS